MSLIRLLKTMEKSHRKAVREQLKEAKRIEKADRALRKTDQNIEKQRARIQVDTVKAKKEAFLDGFLIKINLVLDREYPWDEQHVV